MYQDGTTNFFNLKKFPLPHPISENGWNKHDLLKPFAVRLHINCIKWLFFCSLLNQSNIGIYYDLYEIISLKYDIADVVSWISVASENYLLDNGFIKKM